MTFISQSNIWDSSNDAPLVGSGKDNRATLRPNAHGNVDELDLEHQYNNKEGFNG